VSKFAIVTVNNSRSTPVTIIVTNCTARKKGKLATLKMTPEMIGANLDETICNWRSATLEHNVFQTAGDLYSGRAITEARKAAKSAGASLCFVSTGMGLIPAEQQIPPYDLTPVQTDGGLAAALHQPQTNAETWWSVLTQNGLNNLVSTNPNHLILIALPATYLKMLNNDLCLIPSSEAGRLRIFTSSAGAKFIPEDLKAALMPYDARLESIDAFAGTVADFPQRALRHFVEELQLLGVSPKEASTTITNTLNQLTLRSAPSRKRLDDENISALIIELWKSHEGSSARILRALRDKEFVSCEQKRFATLWRKARLSIAKSAQEESA
jgi:hypothetical protein